MAGPRLPQPSDLELQVLSVLWRRGPLAVRDVLEAMPDGKDRAYTTVLTVLQGLEKKGLADHERHGRQYQYRAAVSKRQVLRPLLRRLVDQVFGGKPSAVLQQLLDETKVTDEELETMRRTVEEHAAKPKGEGREA